jgi:hypothetical protein
MIQCLPIRIGGFQDQACLALFVWSSGLWRPWFPLKGDLGQSLFLQQFFLLILESSGSADFECRSDHPAGFRMAASAYSNMRLGGLAGGSCLSLLWWAAGSVRVQLLCPIFIRSRGSITDQVSFPCQGRYFPVTRPVTLEDDGNGGGVSDSKTVSSGRCSSGSGAVWVFCLAPGGLLGIFWTPFGRRVFLRGALGLPWPPLWAWALPAPVGGCGWSLFVPFPVLILVST